MEMKSDSIMIVTEILGPGAVAALAMGLKGSSPQILLKPPYFCVK